MTDSLPSIPAPSAGPGVGHDDECGLALLKGRTMLDMNLLIPLFVAVLVTAAVWKANREDV